MKLVEIKNSLAKLHYEPTDFPLVLSDFLTIDDGNQKIIAQVVSIESTSIDITNCAVLKFAIDLNDNGEFSSYGGYVPALDALVSKTKKTILEDIFSDNNNGIYFGKIASSSNTEINIKKSLAESFLYVQADKINDIQDITKKIIDFKCKENKKTLYIDFDGINNYSFDSILKLGDNFKLPINNNILDYIYENDLNSLTIEQKTIVQDIILDIQEYIKTLEEGFIPFDSLLNVVNEIYATDKSIGVILLRNKLIKYSQMNIFANNIEEINSVKKSINDNTISALSLKDVSEKWQKETLNFIIDNIDDEICLILNINDEIIDTEVLNKIYKKNNIKPLITSKYDSKYSSQLKSFAQNQIMYKPITQQKDFATYNSFFNKINQNELIISGEATFFIPLIVKGLSDTIHLNSNFVDKDITKNNSNTTINQEEANNKVEYNAEDLAEAITEELVDIEVTDSDTLQYSSEEIIENEIAKDVDTMFLANNENTINPEDKEDIEAIQTTSIDYEEIFSDVDLDMLDEVNEEQEYTNNEIIYDIENEIIDLNEISELTPDTNTTIETEIISNQYAESQDSYEQKNESKSFITEEIDDNSNDNLPIYTTELNEESSENKTNIAEGNIVYHEKYGRGVVEQLISYGKKTLCSIQFDNVGRRLLDPNLADLKQM